MRHKDSLIAPLLGQVPDLAATSLNRQGRIPRAPWATRNESGAGTHDQPGNGKLCLHKIACAGIRLRGLYFGYNNWNCSRKPQSEPNSGFSTL